MRNPFFSTLQIVNSKTFSWPTSQPTQRRRAHSTVGTRHVFLLPRPQAKALYIFGSQGRGVKKRAKGGERRQRNFRLRFMNSLSTRLFLSYTFLYISNHSAIYPALGERKTLQYFNPQIFFEMENKICQRGKSLRWPKN